MEPTAPFPTPAATRNTESTAKIVYVLYLLSFAAGITTLIGVVMAYVNEGDAPEGLRTHYRFQIRTFWIGLLYAVVGGLLTIVGIGALLLLFVAVWLVIRCVKGLRWLDQRQPVPNPATWLW
ncbi:conserved hypothetical protein [Anaeromyxobacter dehalogenans 2CP-1]|uniref:Transmembrane protein n=1 Tax=Anaeromyxobacter dehalogenans (strain ATCC BAA-258 / DSM 21875 / 2CP-1) TaxID=455488 RepID=B8JGS5_ANAD2|nr:membrane protein [Anaeromyxobacter dehalogenans]ACL66562.1 conserved hypothetical protein [Anaeromyxobacter dehalogenans 2CP-1]